MHCIALTVLLFYHITLLEKEMEDQNQDQDQAQEENLQKQKEVEKQGDRDNRDNMIETSMYAEYPRLMFVEINLKSGNAVALLMGLHL